MPLRILHNHEGSFPIKLKICSYLYPENLIVLYITDKITKKFIFEVRGSFDPKKLEIGISDFTK